MKLRHLAAGLLVGALALTACGREGVPVRRARDRRRPPPPASPSRAPPRSPRCSSAAR